MNDARLKEFLDELDRDVPKEGAVVHLVSTSSKFAFITANRAGYLRLAAESIRASAAPLVGREMLENVISANTEYLFAADSDMQLVIFERREDLTHAGPNRTVLNKGQSKFWKFIKTAFYFFFIAIPWLIGVIWFWGSVL